ncbi:MAG: polysaccharide biosynthesis/export family protein [Chitinophagaceae bacterium]|nr:polysaccharide biosynthesis/export family protein [Chitinophagaceae bacterium]MCW5926325.1 polysaccharide biosynthesis/export family protein [Chitinophagaceae bacterium]
MKSLLNLFLHKSSYYFLTIPVFLFFLSCKTPKQVQYFRGSIDTASLSKINIPEPAIQTGDIIGITVFSDNTAATAPFNQQAINEQDPTLPAVSSIAPTPVMPQYLVDADGNIQVYTLGLLHVEGLTRAQLSVLLKEKLSAYLKNPYCVIRFLNYKFTILGEVTRQGVYSIPGETMNILQALGMAGDLTMYGLKDSILVMREYGGQRSFGYLDVSDPNVINSPFYYLKQNDVVMVRANPKKPVASDQSTMRALTITATIASILVSISLIVSRF